MAKKKKLLLPQKRLLLKHPLLKHPLLKRPRWKPLLLKLLLLKLLLLKPLLLKPLLLKRPLLSNTGCRNEKPATWPVFLCPQKTFEARDCFLEPSARLRVSEADMA